LNGALHWLVNHRSHSNEERVLTLDLATETFKEFPTPFSEIDCGIGLEVLGSNLCICVNHQGTQNDVWVMKKYGVAESWTPWYTITQEAVEWLLEYCRPLVFSNTRKRVLLQSNSNITLDKNLFWYDLEKKMVKELKIPGLPSLFTAAICVGSLLLFDGDPVARQQQAKRKFEAGNSRNCLF
jgi:F-box interacting protein